MAVTTLICAGTNYNAVARALSASTAFVVTSDVSSLFPPANLGDGLATAAFRFQTTSSGTISVDRNVVTNGTMETAATSGATVLANWIVDSGTVTRSSAQASRGSWSMQLVGASVAHLDILATADERFTFSAALRGDATNFSKVQVQNLQTFSYLTSTGGWQVGQTYCITGPTAASWTTSFRTGNIEPYATPDLEDTMWLRITVQSTAGTVYADDVIYSPATNLVAGFGFLNVDPGITVKIVSSSDNFTTQTTEATISAYYPSFYYYTSTPIDREYLRLYFVGVNSSQSGPIFGGEVVMAQPTVMTRTFSPAYSLAFNDAQERQETVLGLQQVYRLGLHPVRTLSVPYVFTNLGEYQQFRDVIRRAQLGAQGSVIIPASTDPEVCMLARIDQTWVAVQGPMPNYFEASTLKAIEMPFPAWVA